MSFRLEPINKKIKPFMMNYTSWFRVLKILGFLFSCTIDENEEFVCNYELDARMGKKYPRILSNDGFKITNIESKFIARIIKNYVGLNKKRIRQFESYFFKDFITFAENSKGFRIY